MPRQISPKMRESPTLSSFALEDATMSQRCKAIEDIYREGFIEGYIEGYIEEYQKYFQEGYREGRIEGPIMTITGVMENLGSILDKAMNAAGVPENERDFYIQKLRQKTS